MPTTISAMNQFTLAEYALAERLSKVLLEAVPGYADHEDLPAAIKAVAGYAAEIACNKLEGANAAKD
jgi:hypothetical protein